MTRDEEQLLVNNVTDIISVLTGISIKLNEIEKKIDGHKRIKIYQFPYLSPAVAMYKDESAEKEATNE